MRWLAVIAALIIAGIIHIAAVLSLPYLAPNDAWDRLSPLAEPNTLKVLPQASSDQQTLPLMAPDMRYAICRYDVSEGPVRLSTQLLDDLWVIALYTPLGENYYTISGGDLKRSKVEMVISTQAETLMRLEADANDDSEDTVIVKAPEMTGIAVIRVPLRGPAHAERVALALRRASCSPQRSVLPPAPTTARALPTPPLPTRN